MARFDFMSPSDLRALGLGTVGRRVLIRKTVRFINPQAIHIGDNIMIDDFALLHAGEPIILEGNNQIAAHCSLFGRFGITMRRYSTLAPQVSVFTESDDYSGRSMTNPTIPEAFKPGMVTQAIEMGKHAIVGAQSVLLPGAQLEAGVAVGAQSLVKDRLQEWGIYGGQPARFLKDRSRELLELADRYEGKA